MYSSFSLNIKYLFEHRFVTRRQTQRIIYSTVARISPVQYIISAWNLHRGIRDGSVIKKKKRIICMWTDSN